MKKCILVSAIFLLCSTLVPAYSQINVLEYFPLNIGDVFTYDDGARAEITRIVELDWLDNVTGYEKVWAINPNPQYTDNMVKNYYLVRGDSLFWAAHYWDENGVQDYAKFDPPFLLGTAHTTPGDTFTTIGNELGIEIDTGMPQTDTIAIKVVINRTEPLTVPYGTFEDCITLTFIEVDEEGGMEEFMSLTLAKDLGVIHGNDIGVATDLAPFHSLTDFQQGVTPSGPKCDFNEDGNITIADVISLLIFQRDNTGDLKADFNQDGVSSIADAIAMLLDMRDGTCPDAN